MNLNQEDKSRQQLDLEATENIFRLLVQGVRDYAIFMISPLGIVMTWNEGAERIKGYKANEIIGKHFSQFYTQESNDRNHPAKELELALAEGKYEEEGWRVRKGGEQFWASVVLTPVFEEDRLIGFAKVTRDLTERKLSLQNDQTFRLLVDSVRDYAIFMLDPDGRVLTWNEGAERIKGYRAEEIIGKHISQFYTPDSRNMNHAQTELDIARTTGRYEEEGWRVRKDGTMFWANVVLTAVYDHGQLIGYAKVTRDLTERKQAEQSEEIFRLMVNGVRDYAIFMLTPEGNVLTWNEGAQRIKGYATEEILGKHFSIFYTKEAQKRKHPENELKIATETGRYEEEGWRIRKDGSLLWASVVITAIFDDGKLIGFAKVTRDLTQRLLADQEREMSAKMLDETNQELLRALDVKNHFLSTISHEVRTPMSGIIGMTELLSMEDLGADHNQVVQNIFQSSKRLLQLLNNLLESARMESGDVALENRTFPLRSVLGDVRQLIRVEAAKKQLKITGTCDPRVPELVFGDELKTRQVLLNLAHNAVKFTDSGEVDVSAEVKLKDTKVTVIRFTVKDTGIGIKDGDREKLFEPFSQGQDATRTSYGGAGLGLNISKQLIQLMGGTIGFESELGKGSKFWFEIPFSEEIKPQ